MGIKSWNSKFLTQTTKKSSKIIQIEIPHAINNRTLKKIVKRERVNIPVTVRERMETMERRKGKERGVERVQPREEERATHESFK